MDFIELDKKYIDVKIALLDIKNSFNNNSDDTSLKNDVYKKTYIYSEKYKLFYKEIENILKNI